MNTEREQKKVAFWSVGFVIGILLLELLFAAFWYYLRGRKTNQETPQTQSQLTIRVKNMYASPASEMTIRT
jgi:hypothetical protein